MRFFFVNCFINTKYIENGKTWFCLRICCSFNNMQYWRRCTRLSGREGSLDGGILIYKHGPIVVNSFSQKKTYHKYYRRNHPREGMSEVRSRTFPKSGPGWNIAKGLSQEWTYIYIYVLYTYGLVSSRNKCNRTLGENYPCKQCLAMDLSFVADIQWTMRFRNDALIELLSVQITRADNWRAIQIESDLANMDLPNKVDLSIATCSTAQTWQMDSARNFSSDNCRTNCAIIYKNISWQIKKLRLNKTCCFFCRFWTLFFCC